MAEYYQRIFICFSQRDRYNIAEPIVYHLRNYGIDVWYDRNELLMGHNRVEKNLVEGASKCMYALPILSANSESSPCFLEELSILEKRYQNGNVTIFPVLYELPPEQLPYELQWIKTLIFKEVDRSSGTREICNHVACRITGDIVDSLEHKTIQEVTSDLSCNISPLVRTLLMDYQRIDNDNLNSRVTMLYAAYCAITQDRTIKSSKNIIMTDKVFERLFAETRLKLDIDYRDLWLLENAICILVDVYRSS